MYLEFLELLGDALVEHPVHVTVDVLAPVRRRYVHVLAPRLELVGLHLVELRPRHLTTEREEG
jgi:hypothetical protein